jgi:hypothetical protein
MAGPCLARISGWTVLRQVRWPHHVRERIHREGGTASGRRPIPSPRTRRRSLAEGVDRRLSYPRGPAQGPVHEPTHRPLARGGFPLVQDCNPCDPQGTLGKPPPVPGSTQRPDLGMTMHGPPAYDAILVTMGNAPAGLIDPSVVVARVGPARRGGQRAAPRPTATTILWVAGQRGVGQWGGTGRSPAAPRSPDLGASYLSTKLPLCGRSRHFLGTNQGRHQRFYWSRP